MKTIYRISSHNYKGRIGRKEDFLKNYLSSFSEDGLIIICDNCDIQTIQMVKTYCPKTEIIETLLGNSGSFRHAIKLSMDFPNEIIYFAEDDYLYNGKNLAKTIEEGLQKADYVTLYNHPDKFEKRYDFGEITKVIRIGQTYWKHTISTTMTFAARAKTLKEDRDTWIKFTQDAIPHDHEAFCSLDRTLICPIPGLACHVDLSDSGEEYLPDWVAEKLSVSFKELLGEQFPEFSYAETPLRQLKIMQALVDIGCK